MEGGRGYSPSCRLSRSQQIPPHLICRLRPPRVPLSGLAQSRRSPRPITTGRPQSEPCQGAPAGSRADTSASASASLTAGGGGGWQTTRGRHGGGMGGDFPREGEAQHSTALQHCSRLRWWWCGAVQVLPKVVPNYLRTLSPAIFVTATLELGWTRCAGPPLRNVPPPLLHLPRPRSPICWPAARERRLPPPPDSSADGPMGGRLPTSPSARQHPGSLRPFPSLSSSGCCTTTSSHPPRLPPRKAGGWVGGDR